MHPAIRRLVIPSTMVAAVVLTAAMATAVDASSASDEWSSDGRPDVAATHASVPLADFNVSAAPCGPGHLAMNPELKRGEVIVVTVRGFAPGASVEIRVAYEAASTIQPRADAAGVLQLVYRVPESLTTGQHLLTLSGLGPTAGAGVAEGNVSVTVPNTGLLHFRVSASRGHVPACDLTPTLTTAARALP